MKDGPSDARHLGEDVSSTRGVFPTLAISLRFAQSTHGDTSSELPVWLQEVDIVASDEILCKPDDGHCQTRLSMVICRLFRHISCQLGHFDLLDEVSLETTVQDFSLTGFETIGYRGYGPDVVGHAEQDQFLVDKFGHG